MDRRTARLFDRLGIFVNFFRIRSYNLEGVDLRPSREVALRFGKRHKDHGPVIFGHAHFENGRDRVWLSPRRGAKRCLRTTGGNERNRVAHVYAQLVC